jgi:hypothetical protein
LEIDYKYYYYDTYYYYNTYSKSAQYWEMNEAQTTTTITVGEFDWSNSDSYILIVDTVHGIYKTEITQADLTNTITLSMDSTYVVPSLSVPFNLSTYDNYGLDFLVYDDQGQFITNYYMSRYDMAQGYKIPSGNYKVQAFGYGDSNSFSLFKMDYDLTSSTKTITLRPPQIRVVKRWSLIAWVSFKMTSAQHITSIRRMQAIRLMFT